VNCVCSLPVKTFTVDNMASRNFLL
jgi:hypothetical protein